MFRLYRYVGPAAIAERVRSDPPGHVVRSQADLRAAISALTGGVHTAELTMTFVVDAAGELRVADRCSEHVACAAGGPVMAAGELGVICDGAPYVEEASNQSTGFCPEASSFPALQHALRAAGISHPDEWTASFEFRRCTACGGRTLVKDGYFECGECGAALPELWNFDRTRACRSVVRGASAVWTVDTIEEASASDQDRLGITIHDDHVVVVLADGAGGTSRGAEAADEAMSVLATSTLRRVAVAADAIRGLDTLLASRASGETTTVLARVSLENGEVLGASVGDSVAWARAHETWTELTEGQRRKPLVGSGRAQPEFFGPHRGTDVLLVASDGLSKYAKWSDVAATLEAGGAELPWRLVDLPRLPSGGLQDDISAALLRVVWTTPTSTFGNYSAP